MLLALYQATHDCGNGIIDEGEDCDIGNSESNPNYEWAS